MKKSIFSIITIALLGNFAMAQNDLSFSTMMSLRQDNLSDFEAAKSLTATAYYSKREYSDLCSAAQKVINIDNGLIKLAGEAEDFRKENQRLQGEILRLRAEIDRQPQNENTPVPIRNARNSDSVEEEDSDSEANLLGWLSKNIAWILLGGIVAFYFWKNKK